MSIERVRDGILNRLLYTINFSKPFLHPPYVACRSVFVVRRERRRLRRRRRSDAMCDASVTRGVKCEKVWEKGSSGERWARFSRGSTSLFSYSPNTQGVAH